MRWTLVATDPATGDVQWRRQTPLVPEVHAVRLGDRVIRSRADLTSDDDRVLLTDSGHAWLFGADGEPRGDVTVETDGWAELARADTLVWTPWQAFAVPAGILVTRDGTRTAVGERPARLAVDDGSAPDVVLLSGDRSGGDSLHDGLLVGRDATSGEELWRLTGTTGEALLVDGVVHVAQGREVRALDARTGESRWVADVGAPPVYVGTDGALVVVVTADRTLRGFDRAGGSSRAWPTSRGTWPATRAASTRSASTADGCSSGSATGRGSSSGDAVEHPHTRVWTVHTGVA